MQHHRNVDIELFERILRGHGGLSLNSSQLESIIGIIKTSFPISPGPAPTPSVGTKRILLLDDDDDEEEGDKTPTKPRSRYSAPAPAAPKKPRLGVREVTSAVAPAPAARVLRPRNKKIVVPDSDSGEDDFSSDDDDSMSDFITDSSDVDEDEEEEEEDEIEDDEGKGETAKNGTLTYETFRDQIYDKPFHEIIASEVYKKSIEPVVRGMVNNWGNQSTSGVLEFQTKFMDAMHHEDTQLTHKDSVRADNVKCDCCYLVRTVSETIEMEHRGRHAVYRFGSFCYARIRSVAEIYNWLREMSNDANGFYRMFDNTQWHGCSTPVDYKRLQRLLSVAQKQQVNKFFS